MIYPMRKHGFTDDAANMHRQRTMLDFAVQLTSAPHLIGQGDRDALSAQGFSDEDIFDIAEVTAFFNYTNRVAHAVDMMPNAEYHTLAR